MKSQFKITAIIMLFAAFAFSACGGSDSNSETPPLAAGDKVTFTAGGVSFNMAYVPGSLTFPTGTDDSGTATVANACWIGEAEVTYELWSAVRTWAIAQGYNFANAGAMGDGAGDTNQHPVTAINWRDAIVWMNALTEYYNANNGSDPDLDYVYYTDATYTTPIKDSSDGSYAALVNTTDGSFDKPYIKAGTTGNIDMANCTAKGFRLPASMEWECAARYKDGTNWTAGNYASGATADYNDAAATDLVAWYSVNSGSSTHVVKGKTANALGLYDMSGNVAEWCFDWHPDFVGTYRVIRGGCWANTAYNIQLGYVSSYPPFIESNFVGFRLAKSNP